MTPFKLYLIVVYYFTLLLFAAGGLLLNLFCMLAVVVPRSEASERFFQRVVQGALQVFLGWMAFARLTRVQYDPAIDSLPRGVVLVANHPGLMDSTYLLARLPQAVCLFKAGVRRNPILGAAATRAGYIVSNEGVDTIRTAIEKVAAGHTLMLFPEGTRTPQGMPLGPLRPGFAMIAQRAGAPVQLVRIRCNSPVLAKGWSTWKIPVLPINVRVEVGPRLVPDGDGDPVAVTNFVGRWLLNDPAALRAGKTGALAFSAAAAIGRSS